MSEDFMEEGRQKADSFITNPQRVTSLIEKSQKVAPTRNEFKREEIQRYVLNTIKDTSDGMLTAEIAVLLSRKKGMHVSRVTVREILQALEGDAAITAVKEGKTWHYFPSELGTEVEEGIPPSGIIFEPQSVHKKK